MMTLGELAVMYPVNGGYYEYSVRFLDPSWLVTTLQPSPPPPHFPLLDPDADDEPNRGNALGWTYAISWMLTLYANRVSENAFNSAVLTSLPTDHLRSLRPV